MFMREDVDIDLNLRTGIQREGWVAGSLESFFKLGSGKTKPLDISEIACDTKTIPVFGGNGIIGYSSHFNAEGEKIIIGRVGEYCGTTLYHTGKCWVTDNALYTKEFLTAIDIRFMAYKLQQVDLTKLRSKGGQPLVSQGPIYLHEIELPSEVSEQSAIANLLSTWDRAIALTTELIKQKELRKKWLMRELLSGRKRLNGYTEEWQEFQIGDICEVGRGRVISKSEILLKPGPYPVYSSQTEDDGMMGSISSYDFEGEYITWTTDGVYAGTIFYRSGKFNCTNVCGTLKSDPKKYCAKFLAYALSIVSSKYVSRTLANPKLMNNVMKEVVVLLPQFQEQVIIAEVIERADQELNLMNHKVDLLRNQKKGLMQVLLTGKKRI